MNQLFEFPGTGAANRTALMPTALVESEQVSVTGRSGKAVLYARLSDEDHHLTRTMIDALWQHREGIRLVLDEPSTLYGSRGGGKRQTLGDILDGLHHKMSTRHPFVRGRVGEDLTIKQLHELNRMINALNAQYGDGLKPVIVP